MKKLTLTVATLLSGFHVLAQNNSSVVTQLGDYNKGTVNQNGKHSSSVLQTSNATLSTQENVTDVTQKNISAFNLKESDSKVEQFGHSHTTTVIQDGKNTLEAYIGSSGAFNQNNETYSKQYGSENAGLQRIEGSVSTVSFLSLNQSGISNTSDQVAHQAVDSKGIVTQSGNFNDASQRVEGSDNEARIQQTSDGNSAFQQIIGWNSADNFSMITQSGKDNNARIVTEGDNNRFDATQLGDRNSVVGLAGTPSSNATQRGDGNNILLNQIGNDNAFHIRQEGNDNTITGTSVSGALQLGNNNTGVFAQDGSDLKIISDQFGNNNMQIVTQTGNGSESTVFQSGTTNMARVTQADH
ncbi:hypothetical protein DSL64_22745 [Dyadobacter luteus]|uniref:Curlin associated repeat-containing protein n=1 Tax=Dyadobacter luteus TaxID=2259619 RepID=A0A3D8Y6Q5_9BACT|nr:hypothetical protein [Dyadobacter luteus]REA57755.1 hypothetical protein DSL64_22745 [Dyadobacter luteus]